MTALGEDRRDQATGRDECGEQRAGQHQPAGVITASIVDDSTQVRRKGKQNDQRLEMIPRSEAQCLIRDTYTSDQVEQTYGSDAMGTSCPRRENQQGEQKVDQHHWPSAGGHHSWPARSSRITELTARC